SWVRAAAQAALPNPIARMRQCGCHAGSRAGSTNPFPAAKVPRRCARPAASHSIPACPSSAAPAKGYRQACNAREMSAVTRAAHNRQAPPCTRRGRASSASWPMVLLAAAAETRLSGAGGAPGWTENQALRLGFQFAQDFIQLLRGAQQAFTERVETRHGLASEFVAQLPAGLRECLDRCLQLRGVAHRCLRVA